MNILVVAATYAEIMPVMEYMKPVSSGGERFYSFAKADVLITGLGMVATAYHLGRHLQNKKYDLAVNAGICGCFRDIPMGTVVNVVQDLFSEFGAEDHNDFITMSGLGLDDPASKPYFEGKLVNKEYPRLQAIASVPEVKGITVNTVHGNRQSIESVIQRFDPDTESMEGGAFFYSCINSDVKALQIRAISNKVERRNRSNWNIPLAVRNLNDTLIQIIDEMNL